MQVSKAGSSRMTIAAFDLTCTMCISRFDMVMFLTLPGSGSSQSEELAERRQEELNDRMDPAVEEECIDEIGKTVSANAIGSMQHDLPLPSLSSILKAYVGRCLFLFHGCHFASFCIGSLPS